MMKNSLIIFVSLLSYLGFGQNQILQYDEFIKIVRENHPIAKQAELRELSGTYQLKYAKGNFDAKIFSDIDQKYFDEKRYYSLMNSGLSVPAWFGIDVKAGYEQNIGDFTSNQNRTPNAGLWYAGVSVPVGKGLLIDERRVELKKAKLNQSITEKERQILLNDLVFEAGVAYWSWFISYNKLLVYQEALELAQTRFRAVSAEAKSGNRPFIDTLEAGIQVQNRLLALQESELQFKNTQLQLSVYLWAEGFIPLEIAVGTIPGNMDLTKPINLQANYLIRADTLDLNHPEIQRSAYKIQQLEVDKRWKIEQFIPEVRLNYNFLSEPLGNSIFPNYSINNYKWGMNFRMPLSFAKERQAYNLAKVKLKGAEIELENKKKMIETKALKAINKWQTTKVQFDTYEQTVKDYGSLLQGERQMFDAGESSLFMVNSREMGYINAQIKLIELLAKNHMAAIETDYVFDSLWKTE